MFEFLAKSNISSLHHLPPSTCSMHVQYQLKKKKEAQGTIDKAISTLAIGVACFYSFLAIQTLHQNQHTWRRC